MGMARPWAAVLGAVALAAGASHGGELLRNGSFLDQDAAAGPACWRVVDDGQRVELDQQQGALRVEITQARENDGQIGQRVERLPAGRAYVLSGRLRSTKPGIAYLQVKLHRGGREQQRLTASQRSETEWRDAELTFATGDADAVEVICRFRQRDDTLGQTVWFSGLQLREAEPPRLVRGEAVATFAAIGIGVEFSGGLSSQTTGRVRYRPEGDTLWREGPGLVPCIAERQLRGSLFGLTPDTAYEIECQLVDPAVQTAAPLVLHARTWQEQVPIAETRVLPAPDSGGVVKIDARGKPDAWILYRPAAEGPVEIAAAAKGEQALLITNAAYVIVEGVVLRGGRRDAVRVAKSQHVRIRHCDIAGWGDPGTAKEGLENGRFVDAAGRVINYHAGVRICEGSSQVVVEHCFIHSPRGTANSWAYGHPAGPQGVILDRTGGNNVVRYNDLIGSETHWWNDAIESIANGEVSGGPYRDTDIYGNVLAFSNDDGTELDGGQINVRYWHNWIAWALCGISCAPNRSGPSYVFRNVVATLGEERESTGSAFKMGGAALSPGLSVIAHNTIFGPGGGLRSVGYGNGPDRGAYVAMSRNNLFAGSGHQDLLNISNDPRNDFDYDLTSRGGVRLATGGETHAVTAAPTFVAAAQGDYRLADGSPGIDQGCPLPCLNDDFAGRAPDMGAFESGQGGPDFAPRPHALSVLPLRATAAAPPTGGQSSATVQLVAPPTVGKTWRAVPNSPWLSCTPARGATSGEPTPVRIEITADSRDKPRYRGAVTFRTDRGYVRTVMVEAGIPAASRH